MDERTTGPTTKFTRNCADAADAGLVARGLGLPRRRPRGGAFGTESSPDRRLVCRRCSEPVDEEMRTPPCRSSGWASRSRSRARRWPRPTSGRSPRSSRRSIGSTPIRRAPARPRRGRRQRPTRWSSRRWSTGFGAASRPRRRRLRRPSETETPRRNPSSRPSLRRRPSIRKARSPPRRPQPRPNLLSRSLWTGRAYRARGAGPWRG